jgi:cytochrome c peroxidase
LRYLNLIVILFAIVLSASAVGPESAGNPTEHVYSYIQSQTEIFSLCLHRLKSDIIAIDSSNPRTIRPVIATLKSCRLQYKKISFFLDYFYPQQGKLFNGPAKREVEDPYLEIEEPQSFQQIESILFGPNPQDKKNDLENLVLVLDESATDLVSLYSGFNATNAQVLESIHLELIRIMTLYISGYDTQKLKTGISESGASLQSIHCMTDLFFQPTNPAKFILDSLFNRAIRFTRTADFDHFDRLFFLTRYALPLEEQLVKCIKIYGWQLSTVPTLNYDAKNLFRGELENQLPKSSDSMAGLGRTLFFEKALSGNNSRSCATCHQPDRYFTDQKVANKKINNDSLLRRNTPTLLYVSYQSAQFWDGHAATLPEQIGDVLTSADEMNVSIPDIKRRLLQNNLYRFYFRDSVTLIEIEAALTAYLNTLQPMNSSFDRYMSGDQKALSSEQKKGFNLFMGKAQCGTCHFAPVFNGSTPPFFNHSEYEVLGVPGIRLSSAKLTKLPDEDLGRYERIPVSLYRRAFKTPTVRNVAHTQPYMHNGHFKTLQAELDFYNQGGGAGIGLDNPEQTLSEKKLHLSQAEIIEIIAFLGALTDNLKTAGLTAPQAEKHPDFRVSAF